jgi:hypothetical protein
VSDYLPGIVAEIDRVVIVSQSRVFGAFGGPGRGGYLVR